MSATRADALRRRMQALSEAQTSETLLESWITLARKFVAGQVPPAERAALAHGMETIQRTLKGRGMDHEQFDTLWWMIEMERGQ